MDIQTILIFFGAVAIPAIIVYLILVKGFREKTYEEAIAEQRKIPNEQLLVGRNNKEKVKEKKLKKAGKKVKEKSDNEKNENEKVHVNFEKPEAEQLTTLPSQEEKKKKKKDKIKPILLNKDEKKNPLTDKPPVTNHFEKIHPKDDLELKKEKLTTEETKIVDPVETLPTTVPAKKEKTIKPERAPKTEKPIPVEPVVLKEEITTNVAAELVVSTNNVNSSATSSPATSAKQKKKKTGLDKLQQMSGEYEGVNVSLLERLVRKAELSRTEVQLLIDLLLNKQQAGGNEHAEWIEGRADPVVKLRKQLSERERLLAEEQEAGQAVQAKLRELRTELNAEKARVSTAQRQHEANLAAKQTEWQNLLARANRERDTLLAEKKQFQQLQAQLADEVRVVRAQCDEVHGQRRQLEAHILRLSEARDEREATLTTQLTQIHAQLQEQQQLNETLNNEIQALRDTKTHVESKLLLEQQNSTIINHLECQRNQIQHQLLLSEEKFVLQQQRIESMSTSLDETNLELEAARIMQSNQHAELQRILEDNERLSAKAASLSSLEHEAQQLREENESLAAQVTAVTERPAAEGRENGDSAYTEQSSEKSLEFKENEAIIEKLTLDLKNKDSLLEQLNTEISNYKTDISLLKLDLENQKKKNDDLRNKNWKAMEAISSVEKNLESKEKQIQKITSETTQIIRQEEQNFTKRLLERLFPDISIGNPNNYKAWIEKFESDADNFLKELKLASIQEVISSSDESKIIELEKQNASLQTLVGNLQEIIQQTEGFLTKLQSNAEEDEEKWRTKLAHTQAELDQAIAEKNRLNLSSSELTSEMQTKLREVENKFSYVQKEKEELILSLESLKRGNNEFHDKLGHLEKLQEEKNRVSQELNEQLTKSGELSEENERLKNFVQSCQEQLQQVKNQLGIINQNGSSCTGKCGATSNGNSVDGASSATANTESIQTTARLTSKQPFQLPLPAKLHPITSAIQEQKISNKNKNKKKCGCRKN